MKVQFKKYKNAVEFGKDLGLSALDIQLIHQKNKIIKKLRKARARKGLTQTALAHLVSSKQPAIARMESGQVSEVSLDFLCKVAFVLDVTVSIRPHNAITCLWSQSRPID